jgi:hypothetical protein
MGLRRCQQQPGSRDKVSDIAAIVTSPAGAGVEAPRHDGVMSRAAQTTSAFDHRFLRGDGL